MRGRSEIAVALGIMLVATLVIVPLARAAPATRIAVDPCLERLIASRLQEAPGTFAVAAADATTLRGAMVDGERLFYGASLYKLWILESVYRAVEAGHMRWDESIPVPQHEEPTPTAVPGATATPFDPHQTPTPVPTRTIDQAVEEMATLSANPPALALLDNLDFHLIQAVVRSHGGGGSAFGLGANQVSAADMLAFLLWLVAPDAPDVEIRAGIVDRMARQAVRDRIPAGVPPGIVVANKTGNEELAMHDVGLIFAPAHTIALAVLSDGVDDPWGEGSRFVAGLTRAIYDQVQRGCPMPDDGRGFLLRIIADESPRSLARRYPLGARPTGVPTGISLDPLSTPRATPAALPSNVAPVIPPTIWRSPWWVGDPF